MDYFGCPLSCIRLSLFSDAETVRLPGLHKGSLSQPSWRSVSPCLKLA